METTEKIEATRGKLVFTDEGGTEVASVEVAMPPYYMKSVLRAARSSMVQNAVKSAVPVEAPKMEDRLSTETTSRFSLLARGRLAARIYDKWQVIEEWSMYGMLSPLRKVAMEDVEIVDQLGDLVNNCHVLIARLAGAGDIPMEEMEGTEKTQAARGKLSYVEERGKEVNSVEVDMPPYFMKSVLRAARTSTVGEAVRSAISVEDIEKDDPQRIYKMRQHLSARIYDIHHLIRSWVFFGMLSTEEKVDDALEALAAACHVMVARLAEAGEIPTEELNKR